MTNYKNPLHCGTWHLLTYYPFYSIEKHTIKKESSPLVPVVDRKFSKFLTGIDRKIAIKQHQNYRVLIKTIRTKINFG